MPRTATADRGDSAALLGFVRPRHRTVPVARRAGGFPPGIVDKL